MDYYPRRVSRYAYLGEGSYSFLRENRDSDEKAQRLLWSKLSDAQRRDYQSGYIDVTGSRGGLYRIYTSSSVQNITSRGYTRRRGFCAGPARMMPVSDALLAQKLLIEADEGLFLRVAHRWS